MGKIDWCRMINAVRPDIGEHVMVAWGKPELSAYLRGMLAVVQPGKNGWGDAHSEALRALRELHRQEYPQFPDVDDAALEARLEQISSYRVVNGRFPHIGRRLRAVWGLPAFNTYLQELGRDTRDGKRLGFPPEVLFALFALQEDHNREFPELAPRISDIWTVGGAG